MTNKNKKTKILAIGDIHGDSRLMKKLAQQAKEENVDIVILAGDLTFAEQEFKEVIKPFTDLKKQVLLIPGNHESVATTEILAEIYSPTRSIHGYSFIKDNLGIFGAGGADIGIHTIKDAELYGLLKRGNESVKNLEKKILVTHIHPFGTKSEFSGFKGSKAVRKAIETFKPNVAICAHIHEASGVEDKIGNTRVINVSRKGKVFEV
ncbi:metallophosphoesterase [Candidatus Pacearchaeota archaeon]|nr:metallophosphoesterase [Candidatus Pacearchaeota archaeon]